MKNSLLSGDNLPIMRERIATDTDDLVYLDHPFKSDLNYHMRFSEYNEFFNSQCLRLAA